jgi:hypothetical protein
MTTGSTHEGGCFCGAVGFAVSGEPVAMGYCHCESCRHWSAAPVNAFTLWPTSSFRITRGAEHIASYTKTPQSARNWCTRCGGHVYTQHPGWNLTDVFVALLPTLAFKPAVHVHYQERVLQIRDGLPKMKDLPTQMGGSGDVLPE